MNSSPSDTVLFFGHFHPLLVHLPIGMIVLVAILETLGCWPRFQQARVANGYILALAAPAAILSSLFGWLLSLAGGYEAQLLGWHKWTGIGVAAACTLALVFHRLRWVNLYRPLLAVTCGVLVVASHFGGSLTHGSDYLTRYAPAFARSWLGAKAATRAGTQSQTGGIAQQPVFVSVILPIFEKNCVACHGPEKSKAGLHLDSFEAVMKGSDNGPVFKPGQSGDNRMIELLQLPLDHEDHMPPDGKPQPTPDDIALLQWWIEAGAPGDKIVADLKPSADIQRILESNSTAPTAQAAPPVTPLPVGKILSLAGRVATELGIAVTPLGENQPWLQCNASVLGTNFGDAELVQLAPVARNVRWLDLAGTAVTDTGLEQVAAMGNLTKLHLERTAVTDEGLTQLAGLRQLEYLNLYGTAVTDDGLAALKPLSGLRQLYLWQTQVSSNSANALARQLEDQDSIQRWQEEIGALQARIRSQQVRVEVGIPLVAASKPESKPMNSECPVSGKDIDLSKTVVHDGKVIAFCCDKCKAAFEKNPGPCLAKLGLAAVSPNPSTDKKP